MYRHLLVLILLIGGTVALRAQEEVVFHTEVSAEKIGRQDQLQVNYVLQNARDVQSILPQGLDEDFEILGGPYRSSSMGTQIINGQVTRSSRISLTFILRPRRLGKLKVPEAVARDQQGNSYRSNAVEITVIPGRYQQRPSPREAEQDLARRRQRQREAYEEARRQQRQEIVDEVDRQIDIDRDLFIRVVVDKQKVYLGEQITASYKLYSRIPMKVNISKLPSLNGFWTQDFEIPQGNIKPTEEVINGKPYQVFLLKKSALFPQQTGELTLDEAEAEGVARVMKQVKHRHPLADWMDPQSLFGSLMIDDPFFRDDLFTTQVFRDIPVKLKSKPVKIEVLPLPDSAAGEDFHGAVGQFTMEMDLSHTQISTDDQAVLLLKIKGTGNLKLFDVPRLNLPSGLVAYEPLVHDSITGRSTTIRGEKQIRYAIGALNPGKYRVEPIVFTYFDPEKKEMVRLQTRSFELNVVPGEGFGELISGKGLIADLHPVRAWSPDAKGPYRRPLFFQAGYWSLYALPLLGFLGFLFWKRREEELSKDPKALRRRRANRIAGRRLQLAKKRMESQDHQGFYQEVSRAIWLYLSDKLGISLSALSRELAESALQKRGCPPETMKKLNALLDDCQSALYAPNPGRAAHAGTFDQAVDIISELEEKLSA